MNLEDKHKIHINSDYSVYLDFIEPAYIWASGGTIRDIYSVTSVYDGNFVKAIMRINNICDNLKDILVLMENYKLWQDAMEHLIWKWIILKTKTTEKRRRF